MQKLHLVGFTTDQKGLILSARRGARTGGFHLPIDEKLVDAVEELRAKQAEAEAERVEEEAARPARVESALSVKEIQARLRQGRTVADVAKAAGVDPEWVERFAPPVFAERAQVIANVQSSSLRRARLGPSEHPIAESIRRNLADRNVSLTPAEFAEGWTARQLGDGRWAVRFHYRYRGNEITIRFDVDDVAGEIVAADRQSGQLGYLAPATPPSPARGPRPGSVPTPSRESGPPKRPTVTVGFRPDDTPGRATSPAAKERERANEAMRKATAKAVIEAERAAARRAKEREAEQLRRQREAEAEEARQARAQAAAERAKASAARKKAAAAKKRADDRAKAKAAKQAADQARRAEATLRAAERRTAAAKKAAAKKAAAKKAAAKKAVAKKAPFKKTTVAKPPATQPAPVLVLRPTVTESTAPAPSSNGGAPETPPGETPPRPLRAT